MEEKTGYYFKSENDTQSYYFINFTEINNKQNVIVDVNKIDTSSGVDRYWDLESGTTLELMNFEYEKICTLELWVKYFFTKFESEGMQMYYDNKKYYDGKYKSDEIQSLADAINFAIEKGLELADIKPY